MLLSNVKCFRCTISYKHHGLLKSEKKLLGENQGKDNYRDFFYLTLNDFSFIKVSMTSLRSLPSINAVCEHHTDTDPLGELQSLGMTE